MASHSPNKASVGLSQHAKAYLLAYNLLQALGWMYLLQIVVMHYVYPQKGGTLWSGVKSVLMIVQNAAVLEVVHAALRLISSSAFVTAMQVSSRVVVVCGVLLVTPTGSESPGLPLALVAWSLAEIVRYLFYLMHLCASVPYFLLWLRYTLFIVLYPVGVTGEVLCLYAAQAYAADTSLLSVTMPNPLNVTFSYHYFLIIVMLLYLPAFPQLYLHMFAQRRKVIGGGTGSTSASKVK